MTFSTSTKFVFPHSYSARGLPTTNYVNGGNEFKPIKGGNPEQFFKIRRKRYVCYLFDLLCVLTRARNKLPTNVCKK